MIRFVNELKMWGMTYVSTSGSSIIRWKISSLCSDPWVSNLVPRLVNSI